MSGATNSAIFQRATNGDTIVIIIIIIIVTLLSRMNFSGHAGHVTIFSSMLTTAWCCSRVRVRVRIMIGLSVWLDSIIHTNLYYFWLQLYSTVVHFLPAFSGPEFSVVPRQRNALQLLRHAR